MCCICVVYAGNTKWPFLNFSKTLIVPEIAKRVVMNVIARYYSSLAALFLVVLFSQGVESQDTPWARRSDGGREVVTNLQFYFHDTFSGRNPSAVTIVQPVSSSATSFGSIVMTDDPLTVGPDPNSKVVGQARGLYGQASQSGFGLIMAMSYGFTDGIYDGSSFSVLCLNPAMNPVRELAVVGGTGLFRLARGYAILQTYSVNPNGDAVVGYNVTLITYV